MKKIFAMVLALFFVTATSNLVMANSTTHSKTHKKHKHKKSPKKVSTTSTSNSTAPAK